jgi:hypothetical protein
MALIYDYSAFSNQKKVANSNQYTFGVKMEATDIDIHNRPEEFENITDRKAFVDYSVNIDVSKSGIEGISFVINSIEIELEVDDYPNDTKEIDFDIIPGKTLDFNQVSAIAKDNVIPSYPSGLEIDMGKSTDTREYKVTVYFGKD